MSATATPEPEVHDTRGRFAIRTYGCQMNVHDSEKIATLLARDGFTRAPDEQAANLLVINTCSIRDKAEQHLYSDLGRLREWKAAVPGRLVGVGGCVAQQVGDGILRRFGHVDFVFGTHNLRLLPALVAAAEAGERSARTDETRSLDRFELPQPGAGHAAGGAAAYITVMEGCDMFCSFCIVPLTRGREISRPAAAILADAEARAAAGVREITLLGQTVNAYGRHDVRRGHSASAGTMAFADLLGKLDRIPGIERIRYTSPHPIFFDDALVRAHAELEHLCPHVHLPSQSGSDAVLERMRRRYTQAELLGIVERLRDARPDVAITTDLIVGFPGESDDDFEQTLELVRRAAFVDSYSFKYSPRPGTAAAAEDASQSVPAKLAQERLERLQDLQREQTLRYHRQRVGEHCKILLDGPSRHSRKSASAQTLQWCGRDPQHRVVNLAPPDAGALASGLAAGQLLDVALVEATPHSLIGELVSRAG